MHTKQSFQYITIAFYECYLKINTSNKYACQIYQPSDRQLRKPLFQPFFLVVLKISNIAREPRIQNRDVNNDTHFNNLPQLTYSQQNFNIQLHTPIDAHRNGIITLAKYVSPIVVSICLQPTNRTILGKPIYVDSDACTNSSNFIFQHKRSVQNVHIKSKNLTKQPSSFNTH